MVLGRKDIRLLVIQRRCAVNEVKDWIQVTRFQGRYIIACTCSVEQRDEMVNTGMSSAFIDNDGICVPVVKSVPQRTLLLVLGRGPLVHLEFGPCKRHTGRLEEVYGDSVQHNQHVTTSCMNRYHKSANLTS